MHNMDQYQQFIHLSRYARWNEELKRRETWDETVSRYITFFKRKCPQLSDELYEELRTAILNHKIMPSMRALMTAGPALERDSTAGYNCAFAAVKHPRVFDEILAVLLCGTGVGFSVERQFVNQLPHVSETFHKSDTTIVVADSKMGWAGAFRELVSLLYSGQIPSWDMSKVRPAGARLKTFGGRASGPEPLKRLFEFTVNTFVRSAGRKLTSIECHDLVCKIAEVVVVGGVRRSALVSLSNLSDDRMRAAKTGKWWETNGQRALANNSSAHTEKPEIGIFMQEWLSLYNSKSGERGFVNRAALKRKAAETGRRDPNHEFGVNPCVETSLRSEEFCNLTEVIIRVNDTYETLAEKVRLATILGTLQATLTDFRYLRSIWKKNCEDERLLGVSLTGIMDNTLMNGRNGLEETEVLLNALKEVVIATNKECAGKLGINQAAAATCVKPSGTVSNLVNSSSGIHTRYAPYYTRTVRGDKKDPLSVLLYMSGVPAENDVTKPLDTWVFSFPVASPAGSVYKNDFTAIQQLEIYLAYQRSWSEHNVSVTVYVRETEWLEVGAWVYKHFDEIAGVSFLPSEEGSHTYEQAPYQEITKEEYDLAVQNMPTINWDQLGTYEQEDCTSGSQELACVAGGCDL